VREYIIPNWHAILIHAPLGLLTTGLILEILTLLFRRSTARVAARWMILVGAITAVPALTSGFYAYHDVIAPITTGDDGFADRWDDLMEGKVRDRVPESTHRSDTTLHDITARQLLDGKTGEFLRQHILFNALGLAGIFLVVVTFLGCSDGWRRKLYLPLLLILMASQGAIVFAAHHGGLVVYQQGAAVQPLVKEINSDVKPTIEEQIKSYLPPAQVHFTMAGWVLGLAFVALGLSIRAITSSGVTVSAAADDTWLENRSTSSVFEDSGDPAPTLADLHDPAPRRTVDPVIIAPPAGVPSARFWLLSLLAALITSAAGLWLNSIYKIADLKTVFQENRNRYHIITGSAIIVLTLILAFLARFARRAKWTLAIFSVLLFGAIALQIYVGVLLSFDGPKGPTDKSTFKNITAPLHWWPHVVEKD
jgi:hypothetical protein